MPGNVGPLEIAIVLIIALLVFGPKRLPELGKSLGKGIREFKGSIGGENDHDEEEPDEATQISAAEPAPAPPVKEPPAAVAKTPPGDEDSEAEAVREGSGAVRDKSA